MQFRVFRPAAALAGLLLIVPLAALAEPAAPTDQPPAELQVADLPPQDLALPASAVPPIDKTSDLVLKVDSAGKLSEIFDSADYALADVRDGEADVPRLLVEAMPSDLRRLDSTDLRKDVFFNALLPLVLRVNEDIGHDRDRLLALQGLQHLGLAPSADSRAWLAELGERYGVADGARVRVVSRRGSVEAPARYDATLRPGLAFMNLHFPDAVATNVLTIDATDPKSGTAEFKATAIRLEAV